MLCRFVEFFGFNLIGDAVQIKTVVVFCDGVDVSADLERVFKCLFHGDIEPEFDAGGDEIDGKEEENNGRQERQGYEGDDQLGAQFCSHHLAFAVIEQFDQVSQNEKNQQEQQEHVDVDQDEHQYGIGDGEVGAEMNDPVFGKGQQGDQGNDNGNDDDFSFTPFLIVDG